MSSVPNLQDGIVEKLLLPLLRLTFWLFKKAFVMVFAVTKWLIKSGVYTLCLAFLVSLWISGSGWWLFFKILVTAAVWALGGWLFVLHIRRKGKKLREITHPTAPVGLTATEPRGVYFGKQRKNHVIKPEELDGHILTVGGVGSGKSSCIAIPTLRAWKSAVFAIDIKGELYRETKDFRKEIHVFNPLDDNTYGYDPYYFLKNSRNLPQEARAIAQAVVTHPPEIKEPFWIESAQNIFTAAILHYYSEKLTFLDTIRKIQSTPPAKLGRTDKYWNPNIVCAIELDFRVADIKSYI